MTDITRRGLVKAAVLAPLALPLRSAAQPVAGSEHFDFVVAGAGHNSLVCSAYLAKAGYKVVVLDGRPTIGGAAKLPKCACLVSKRTSVPRCTADCKRIHCSAIMS